MHRIIYFALFFIVICSAEIFAQKDGRQKQPDTMAEGQPSSPVIEAPKAVYPKSGKKDNISGSVTVKVTVDQNGKVTNATVVNGLEQKEFRDSAIAAAMQARFHPLIREGKPVIVIRTLEYNFILEDDLFPEKFKLIGVGLMLEVVSAFAEKPELMLEIFGPQDELSEIADDPDYGKFVSFIRNYSTLTPEKRRKEAQDGFYNIRKSLNPDQQWELDMGKHFGAAISPAMQALGEGDPEKIFLLDPTETRSSLIAIKKLSENPPKEIDAGLFEMFKKLGKLSELKNPFSRENARETIETIMGVTDKFSSGKVGN